MRGKPRGKLIIIGGHEEKYGYDPEVLRRRAYAGEGRPTGAGLG